MFVPYVSEESVSRVEEVLRGGWVGQGALVDEFEKAVEKTLGISNTVAVNCSSSALRLALDLCGLRSGDEVVTTPMTCTATNHPILEQHAVPVFADIQTDTGNLDPTDVEKRITARTKAIVCTHWAGYPCDLDELNEVAERYRIPVIEDASEAFGARYHGRPIGSISRFAAFSFQAVQINTTGEGGLLASRDIADADAARRKRWYGIDRVRRQPNILGYYDFDVTEMGYGYHMTNIAAAIGLANLKTVGMQQARRREIAERYRKELQVLAGITLFRSDEDRSSAHHFFCMHVARREDFCRKMAGQGVHVSIVHNRNDAYSVFGGLRKDLPGLEEFSGSYIGLPIHACLKDDEVEAIIQIVRSGW